ncbi:hypothetical protein ACLOJK_034477, partial [Asimina triloba]
MDSEMHFNPSRLGVMEIRLMCVWKMRFGSVMVLAIWIIDGSARSIDGGLGVIDKRAIDAAGRHGYRRLHWSKHEGGAAYCRRVGVRRRWNGSSPSGSRLSSIMDSSDQWIGASPELGRMVGCWGRWSTGTRCSDGAPTT